MNSGRVAAVVIREHLVALIERRWKGQHYYLFPGGAIEAAESLEQALRREVTEELGLDVSVDQLLAEVTYQGALQWYFLVSIRGGEFGHGLGMEMTSREDSEWGSYTPVWVPLEHLPSLRVYPRRLVELLLEWRQHGWPISPARFEDAGRATTQT